MPSVATTLIFGCVHLVDVQAVIFGDVANARVAELKDINGREFLLLHSGDYRAGMGLYPEMFISKMQRIGQRPDCPRCRTKI